MNPQTHEHEPGTPVIVKMGGNPLGASPICIASDDLPFFATDKQWKDAESTAAGRICELKFKDGDMPDQYFMFSARPEVMTSLEVRRVADGALLFEVGETNFKNSLRLKVSSNIPFQVNPKQSAEGWHESETQATFMSNDVKIVFKQRNITQNDETRLEYTFSSTEKISATIYFPRPSDN